MNVLLIQPPDPPCPVEAYEPAGPDSRLFSPPWSLLCLRAYLLEHTRHLCSVVDARLFSNLEAELVQAFEQAGRTDVAVVNTTSLGLGQTAAVLDIIKRHLPETRTVICGQHPSQYPEHVGSMPRVDFGLAGDPEPILRNLLDYIDVEQRLRRVPGLVRSGNVAVPYWLPDLTSLSLPDWRGVFWGAYRLGEGGMTCRMLARLSRGHSHCPADRAYGDSHEPLRTWPMERLVGSLQKAGYLGVTEVFLTDPPGIWTPERLHRWCRSLIAVRNVQPWGLHLLPTLFHTEALEELETTLCRRVEIIFPSCDPALLRQYGCIVTPRQVAATLHALESLGIAVHLRFWVGGPEEPRGESARVARMVHALGYRPFSVHPFPFALDSPMYQDFEESASTHLTDWIAWSRDPWILERPVSLWGGPEAAPRVEETIDLVRRAVRRSPRRLLKHVFQTLRSTNWISYAEEKAVRLITPPSE